MKRIIICDFDGTVIEGNIENCFTRFLLQQKELRIKLFTAAIPALLINLPLNKLCLPSVIKSWTYVLKQEISHYIDLFLKENNRKLKIKKETISLIKEISHDKSVLLTGSYQELVERFLEYNNIKCFDKIIGAQVKLPLYLFIKKHPYGKEKCKYVDRTNYNIGIADNYSDHFYLDMCNEKYYIK